MPKITKKELLDKVMLLHPRRPVSKTIQEAYDNLERDWNDLVETVARALGYEVADEPEPPERIAVGQQNPLRIYAEPTKVGGDPIVSADTAELAAEIVRRYNAKTIVLNVAEVIAGPRDRDDDSETTMHVKYLRALANSLRAAYEV